SRVSAWLSHAPSSNTLSRTRAHGRAHHRRGAIHLLGGLAHLRHNTTGGRLFPACPVGALRVDSRRGADGVKGLPGRHERPHRSVADALVFPARAGASRPPHSSSSPSYSHDACRRRRHRRDLQRKKSLANSNEYLCSSASCIPTAVFYYRANRVAKPPLLRPDTVSRLLAAL